MKRNAAYFYLIISILFLASSAHAVGFGIYGNFNPMWGGYDGNDASRTDLASLDYSKINIGGGFLLDFAVARRALFNYRVSMGMESVQDVVPGVTSPVTVTYHFSGFRLKLMNSFGFGVVRRAPVRVWLGPQLGFTFLNEWDASSNGIRSFGPLPGLAAGVNINMGPVVTLGFEFDANYQFEVATRAKRSPQESFDASYVGNGGGLNFLVTLMFRARNDRFKKD
jgi:hypothetical protein